MKYFTLALTLAIWLGHPLVAAAATKGDVLVLIDQSVSMHIYNPAFLIKPWLVALIKSLPGPGNVVLAGFDERVHAPLILSRNDIESDDLLRAKLEKVQFTGRVTDFEQPLQYLLAYKGDVVQAVLLTDGEPEIWDDRYWHLSRLVLQDARYGALNARYEKMLAQGVNAKARYRKLNQCYREKNIGFIEERFREIKEKLGAPLTMIDIYGKFSFPKHWAELASARLVVVQHPEKPIKLAELSEQKISHDHKEKTLTQTSVMENKPGEDMIPPEEQPRGPGAEQHQVVQIGLSQSQSAQHSVEAGSLSALTGQPQSQAGPPQVQAEVKVQPVQVMGLPPLKVTVENAREVFPGVAPPAYKSETWDIVLAVGISVLVMALMWLKRELSLRQREATVKLNADRAHWELQRLAQEKNSLEQEHGNLTAAIAEARDDLSRLREEKTSSENELADRRQVIAREADDYKRKLFTEIDDDAHVQSVALEKQRQQRRQETEKECESLRQQRLAAIDREVETEKTARTNAAIHKLEAEFSAKEEAYARKLQGRKEKAMEELTAWKLEETARQQQELARTLAKTEALSQGKIEKWEQDAQVRVEGLLKSRYRELSEQYKKELRLLAEKKAATEKELNMLLLEKEKQQEALELLRYELTREIEEREQKMAATFKEKEELFWQETVAETRQAKEEAMARLRRWETEEKERILQTMQI